MADVDFRVKNGLVVDNGSISLTNTTSTSIAVGSVFQNATGFYVGNASVVGTGLTVGNSTVNVVVNAANVVVSNSSGNTVVTPIQLQLGGRLLANGGTGTAGQVLTSGDSSANVYWATPSVVAGSNTQVQFNDSGSLGGSAAFVFNKAANTLTLSNAFAIGSNVTLSTTTISVGNSTINSQSNATLVRVANTLYSTNVIPGGIRTRDGYFSNTLFVGNSTATFDAKVESSVTIGSNDIYFAVGSLADQHVTLYANGTGPSIKVTTGTITTEMKPGNLNLGGTVSANGSTGTAGYVLTSGGSGNVYWVAAAAGVSGSNTQIQYNNSGTLGASSGLTFNNTTNAVSISGGLGVGTAASSTAGEIRATNNITAYYSSDARLKENVRPISNALEDLLKLRGVRFDWTDDFIQKNGGEDGYFIRKQDVGIIAQELEAVLPELVIDREDGFKAVKYDRIVALLIEAVKELKAEVDLLKQK
jgi:hypothetical protein